MNFYVVGYLNRATADWRKILSLAAYQPPTVPIVDQLGNKMGEASISCTTHSYILANTEFDLPYGWMLSLSLDGAPAPSAGDGVLEFRDAVVRGLTLIPVSDWAWKP